jgi:hypothetical protein
MDSAVLAVPIIISLSSDSDMSIPVIDPKDTFVSVPPGGTSIIVSLTNVVLPEVILVIATRIIRVVVNRYMDGTPLPAP